MTAVEKEPELEKEVSFKTKNPKPAGKLKYFWNDCVARRSILSSISNQYLKSCSSTHYYN